MKAQAFLKQSIWLVILMGAASVLPGNTPAQAGPYGVQTSLPSAFDIVSIRPLKEDDNPPTHITNSPRNGSIKAVNVNVKALMEVAYDLPDTRCSVAQPGSPLRNSLSKQKPIPGWMS
jgi:hypothetical protein